MNRTSIKIMYFDFSLFLGKHWKPANLLATPQKSGSNRATADVLFGSTWNWSSFDRRPRGSSFSSRSRFNNRLLRMLVCRMRSGSYSTSSSQILIHNPAYCETGGRGKKSVQFCVCVEGETYFFFSQNLE